MKKISAVKYAVAAVFLLSSLLGGCAPKATKPPAEILSASPEEILKRMIERDRDNLVLVSKARFTVSSEEGRYSTGIILFAKRPAYLRIESISVFGLPDLVLASNLKALKMFLAKEGKFYIGSASEKLSRFFPIYLDADEAVALALGMPPPDIEGHARISGNMEDGSYRIDCLTRLGERTQSLWIDPANLNLERVEKFEKGERVYSASLKNYKKIGARELPASIDIDFYAPKKMDVSIRFSDGELRPGGKEDFDMEPPPGVTPIYIE